MSHLLGALSRPSGDVPSVWGGVPPLLTLSPHPTQDNQELTNVEQAIETVINQFHCYAVKGQKEYLTPNEMQELVVQKLPHLGKCVGPLEEKIECMGDPDEAKLEFGEYWDMMGDAAKGCRRK
ncbi:protein S100-A14-like isoform X1 [Nyctibius grandis]